MRHVAARIGNQAGVDNNDCGEHIDLCSGTNGRWSRGCFQLSGCTLLYVPPLTPALAELVARRFAVLSEPNRIRLLDALHQREEASVGELADAIDASHANVSKHLNLLLGERMVSRRREGSRAVYWISDPSLIQLCEEVCAGVRQGLRELHALIDPDHQEAVS